MATFVKLNDENIVIEINEVNDVVLQDANGVSNEQIGIEFLTNWSGGYSNWKQTWLDGSKRKHYAGIGWSYDPTRDVFIPPQNFPSWVLNEQSFVWEPPIPYPSDGKNYVWDENQIAWVEIL